MLRVFDWKTREVGAHDFPFVRHLTETKGTPGVHDDIRVCIVLQHHYSPLPLYRVELEVQDPLAVLVRVGLVFVPVHSAERLKHSAVRRACRVA